MTLFPLVHNYIIFMIVMALGNPIDHYVVGFDDDKGVYNAEDKCAAAANSLPAGQQGFCGFCLGYIQNKNGIDQSGCVWEMPTYIKDRAGNDLDTGDVVNLAGYKVGRLYNSDNNHYDLNTWAPMLKDSTNIIVQHYGTPYWPAIKRELEKRGCVSRTPPKGMEYRRI